MKRILVFGAGRSAYFTIEYLLTHAMANEWTVTIADAMAENLAIWEKAFPGAHLVIANVSDPENRQNLIQTQDIVISLLPASFHLLVAEDCITHGVHLITPSYITPEIQELDARAKANNLIILNEMGLDPGIDHMSTMHIIDRLKADGNKITSYASNCGGLVSLANCDNPWAYKISWNPYNIIRAGHDGALYESNGAIKYIPYQRLFSEIYEVEAAGTRYDSYLNRNSIPYKTTYGLEDVENFYRGTIRYKGFCKKWNVLVNLGLTTDAVEMEFDQAPEWIDYIQSFIGEKAKKTTYGLAKADAEITKAMKWLVDDAGKIALKKGTPAANLQKLLEIKWKLNPGDKDRVVMVHEIGYEDKKGESHLLKSWMDLEGENDRKTAMAKTVGLPLALAAELIANDKIKTKGVILPTIKEVYDPILHQLAAHGIRFEEGDGRIA